MRKSRIAYMDSLKGLVCILVFLGHFFYGFYTSTSQQMDLSPVITGFRSITHFFTNGVYTVTIFSFLSGYFISQHINTGKDLVYQVIKRYLRFSVPLLFLFLLLVIVERIFSYDNCLSAAEMLGSSWLTEGASASAAFPQAIFSALFGVLFLGDCSFDNPLWMLHPMYIGFILAGIIVYILNQKRKVYTNVTIIFLCMLAIFISYVSLAVILGMLYRRTEEQLNVDHKLAAAIIVASCLLGTIRIYDYFPRIQLAFRSIDLSEMVRMILSVLTVIGITKAQWLRNVLNQKLFEKAGALSFPIYILHMPVITIFSCGVFVRTIHRYDYTHIYICTEILTFLFVILLSKIWNLSVDKICNRIILKLMKYVSKMLGLCTCS